MSPEQKEQMSKLIAHFGRDAKKVTTEQLQEYCKRHDMTPITQGEYTDHLFQQEHDEAVSKIYPLVLAEIAQVKYVPEYGTREELEAVRKHNDDIRVRIVEIFEEQAISYHMVGVLGKTLGLEIAGILEQAGNTASNKAMEVVMEIVYKHFGTRYINMKHLADYAKEHIEAFFAKKGKGVPQEVKADSQEL